MAKALYRKYRPRTLAEVAGQEQITEVLAKSLKQGKISHAYLFIGPRGTGKTSVARIFAHEINGFEYELEDDYVDIIEIDGASNRGIEDIRELREKAAIAPTKGKYKVYIIDEVHMLTREAFNALLKTLEEPPEHVVFVMATTDAHKVPATIMSRVQVYTFRLAEAGVMLPYLRQVADSEKLKISDEALEIIVKRGGGSFRDSLSLLDQLSTLSDKEITAELVTAAMGLPDEEQLQQILAAYQAGDLEGMVDNLQKILAGGTKPEVVAEDLIAQIVARPSPVLLKLLSRLVEVGAPHPEAKLLVALTEDLMAAPQVAMRATTPKSGAETSNITTQVEQETNTKNTKSAPPKPAEPAPTPNINFNWDDFANKVQELNDAIFTQLNKVLHEVVGDTVHIYPQRKVVASILSREKNRQILINAAGGAKIKIHEAGEKPKNLGENTENDSLKAKISDIMGGEVEETNGGGQPF